MCLCVCVCANVSVFICKGSEGSESSCELGRGGNSLEDKIIL